MQIHHYDEDGVYSHSGPARTDPLERDRYVIPGRATDASPPDATDGRVPVWVNNGWVLKPDFRGVTYWLADGSKREISAVGDVPPEGALQEAPPPPLDQVKAAARVDLLAFINQLLVPYVGDVPAAEVASWTTKAAAAEAFLAGQDAQQITDEASITGENPGELAQSILANAALYKAIIARMTGLRRTTVTAIAAAQTAAGAQAALTAAKEQAMSMLGNLGQSPPPQE